ncbi:hypothetical protein [Wolbachia endosymbiont (group E) of Neria commutata]|uniref:hypothetical protein n=1 Tax=Wolbachia endosymbiont (group E) of Neria commutata TaxID=3066149 RepID=UPI0031331993
MVDFFNSDANFFEEGTFYVIIECGRNNQDYSTFYLEQGENGGLMFRNLFTYITSGGSVHKNIVLNLDDMSITEIIADNKTEACYVNHYKLDSETLFLDGQDLTFNITPDEKNPSQKFSSIRIHRL